MKMHSTKLIKGSFKKNKAKLLLLELLSFKINYHIMQKFSDEERFGKDREHSEKRVKQLTLEKQKLSSWIDTLTDADVIKINCDIELEIKK